MATKPWIEEQEQKLIDLEPVLRNIRTEFCKEVQASRGGCGDRDNRDHWQTLRLNALTLKDRVEELLGAMAILR